MSTDMALTQKPDVYTDSLKWEYSGLQIITRGQLMDYFSSHDFMKAIRDVYAYELELKRRVEEAGDWDKELPEWDNKEVNDLLDKVGKSFPSKEFPFNFCVIVRVYAFANSKCTYQELYMRVVALRETMEDELRSRKMIVVSNSKTEFCDKESAFGTEVALAFPSAGRDILEAGNCYALGLSTACVFHLMRVLEVGLKALVVDIELPYKTEAWGRILTQIDDKMKELRSPDNKSPKKKNLQLYSQCAIEYGYFKDAWRNHVMHEATHFDEHGARSIMEHVRNFMQSISRWLEEVV